MAIIRPRGNLLDESVIIELLPELVYTKDEDPMESIEKRLDEIRTMSKPRRDERYVLDRINPTQKETIMRIHNIPMNTFLLSRRRTKWKVRDQLRWIFKMVRLLLKCFLHRKKYFVDKTEAGHIRKKLEKNMGGSKKTTGQGRSSLQPEMLRSLTTGHTLRTKKDMKRVTWLLHATKAFIHLFPAEMEQEVAKHVCYEKYDDARVIALQGRVPDRFYFVLAGRVTKLRQFSLSAGQVTKNMGYLTKGKTTDPEELRREWMREESLVSKGQVEVLILERDAFMYLQHTTVGPPTEFLRSVDLFEEFPVENFVGSHDAIEYSYYSQGKLILADSNRTPWLYIVKSGQVKVVRRQSVIDVRASNAGNFNASRVDDLGTGKYFSHADAMLGIQSKQKKLKEALSLPQIQQESSLVANPFSTTIGIEITVEGSQSPGSRFSNPVIYRNKKSHSSDESTEDASSASDSPVVTIAPPDDEMNSIIEENETEDQDMTLSINTQEGKRSKVKSRIKLPAINIPMREEDEAFKPHSLWLTSEKTEMEQIFGRKKKKKEYTHRQTHLQLDVLNPGDVFGILELVQLYKYLALLEGLDHMQPALASEPCGVSLISDGAEVIKINKRFFLQYAGNNTMLKVETMYRDYMNEEDAQQILFDKETWEHYKTALLAKMTETLKMEIPPGASAR